MIKILSEGSDPAWRFLLFCESENLRLYASAHGADPICQISREFTGTTQWPRLDEQRSSVRDFLVGPLQDSLFSAMGLWRHNQNLRTNR